jgi:hypothetical protein
MKKIIAIALLIGISFYSCSIVQEYHFNKDFSGSTRLSFDMGSFVQMMAAMDSAGNSIETLRDSLNGVFAENAKKMDSLGLKNFKYGWENESFTFALSYDFDNIEMLNRALNSSNTNSAPLIETMGNKQHLYFTRKGKTLLYSGPKSVQESSSEMESMGEYYQYTVVFTFDRKLKKAINPNINISPDNKKVELKGNMFKIIRPDYNSDITFKLK